MAIESCTIQHKEVPNQSPHVDVSRYVHGLKATISILSKPPFLFQAACFSSIRTRRICSSLCDEASSLSQMSSRKRQTIAANHAIIKQTSCFGIFIFSNSDKNGVFETHVRSPVGLATQSYLQDIRIPWQYWRSRSSFDRVSSRTGALLSALDQWPLGRRRSTALLQPRRYYPQLFYRDRGVLFAYIPLQASFPRLLLWWHFPRAPSTDGALHTGAPSQRSRQVPRPVVLHAPALLLALLTGPMISRLSGR